MQCMYHGCPTAMPAASNYVLLMMFIITVMIAAVTETYSTRIFARIPSSSVSNPTTALSVWMSQSRSPGCTGSPAHKHNVNTALNSFTQLQTIKTIHLTVSHSYKLSDSLEPFTLHKQYTEKKMSMNIDNNNNNNNNNYNWQKRLTTSIDQPMTIMWIKYKG